MRKTSKNIEIKKISDFEALLKAGNTTYTGLVESIGYVYWTTDTLYFIRVNPEELWSTPKYQQIPFPYFQKKNAEIINKTSHTLHIMSKEELRKKDFNLYFAFYGVLDEMMDLIQVPDAIKVNSTSASSIKAGKDNRYKDVLSLGSSVNDQIGVPLGVVSMFLDNKHLGAIGDGLSFISVIDEIDRGEYLMATGDIISIAAGKTKLSPYLAVLDFCKWMYNTDHMQRELAVSYAQKYKKFEALYYDEMLSSYPNEENKNEYLKKMSIYRSLFKECIDKLGYKY